MDRKEAIEIVQKNYPHVGFSGSEFETALRELVPELKENEDERILEAMIFRLGELSEMWFENIFCKQFTKAQILAYLENQKDKVVKIDHDREQQPAEWSEEDEDMRDTIIRDLKRLGGDIVNVKPAYKAEIDWLKSLRPQPHWKPSEEQMEALESSYSVLKAHDTWSEDEHLLELKTLIDNLQKLL